MTTDIRDRSHRLHYLWRYRAYREAGVDRDRARHMVIADRVEQNTEHR